MAVLLFVILILVVLFALMREFMPFISQKVLHKMSNVSDQELEKRQQLAELRNELQHISMVDEFPRYARLQRNITKLSDEVTKYTQTRATTLTQIRVYTLGVCNVLQVLSILSIIWMYRYEPLLHMPKEWFYPIHGIVAFPTGVPGALGVTCWLMVCRSTVNRAINFFHK